MNHSSSLYVTASHDPPPSSLTTSNYPTRLRGTGGAGPQQSSSDGASIAKTEPAAKPWAHFVAGGLGGMTSAALTCPLDVVKTRLQSDFYQSQLQSLRASHPHGSLSHTTTSTTLLNPLRTATRHLRETLQILHTIHRHEGFRALFRGLGANLIGVVPARAINFYVYGNGKRILNNHFNPEKRENVWSVHLAAAAVAGIATGTATNPIWLVKTRLQLDKNSASTDPGRGRRYRNSWDCVKQTVRQEGVRGLYRGLSASYLGVTESTLQWVLYERMKLGLVRREARRGPREKGSLLDSVETWGGRFSAAAGAKLLAAVVTYPHEVVRTRLRLAPVVLMDGGTRGGGVKLKYTGLAQCFTTVWKEEGMAGLYGGMTPHLLRVVPSAAIMFGMYEVILRLFGTTA